MLKFTIAGIASAALMLAATPAVAKGSVIANDMGKCSGNGSAMLVTVSGFKSGGGKVRVQSYEATKAKWLAKGAWLARIETSVSLKGGKMQFCMPLPGPGTYGIAVRHDLDGNGKSGWSDGGGFTGNPDISLLSLKPSHTKTAVKVGAGVTRVSIVLNYRQGTKIEPLN